jgi:hypothetical protein
MPRPVRRAKLVEKKIPKSPTGRVFLDARNPKPKQDLVDQNIKTYVQRFLMRFNA